MKGKRREEEADERNILKEFILFLFISLSNIFVSYSEILCHCLPVFFLALVQHHFLLFRHFYMFQPHFRSVIWSLKFYSFSTHISSYCKYKSKGSELKRNRAIVGKQSHTQSVQIGWKEEKNHFQNAHIKCFTRFFLFSLFEREKWFYRC